MSTLIGPFRQILTLKNTDLKGVLNDDSLDIIENGSVLCEGEEIIEVGSFNALLSKADQIYEIESDQILMPGLIDCHTHLVWGGTRARDYALRMSGESYETILEQGGGIFDSVAKTRAAEKKELLSSLVRRANRHLQDGITTIEVKSGYGLDVENELKILEVVKEGNSQLKADLIPTCLAAVSYTHLTLPTTPYV